MVEFPPHYLFLNRTFASSCRLEAMLSIINDNFTLSQQEIDAISLSIKVALISIFASLPFSIFIAWLLARKEFWENLFSMA